MALDYQGRNIDNYYQRPSSRLNIFLEFKFSIPYIVYRCSDPANVILRIIIWFVACQSFTTIIILLEIINSRAKFFLHEMLLVILLRFSKSFEFGAKMLNTTRTFIYIIYISKFILSKFGIFKISFGARLKTIDNFSKTFFLLLEMRNKRHGGWNVWIVTSLRVKLHFMGPGYARNITCIFFVW